MFALLRRGVLAGILAGLLAGLAGLAVGEPALQRAIDHEERSAATVASHAHDHAHDDHAHDSDEAAAGGHSHGDDAAVSRPWQRAGLVLASTLSGGALGALLALAFALRAARRPTDDPWTAALWLGLSGALAWMLYPLLLAPPNPPGVGDPETINARTAAYFGAVLGGLAIAWLASRVVRALPAGRPRWQPIGVVVALLIAGWGLLWLVLPAPAAPPADFPADVLWEFRLGAIATQATLWIVLTVGFASLVDRRRSGGARSERAGVAASATA